MVEGGAESVMELTIAELLKAVDDQAKYEKLLPVVRKMIADLKRAEKGLWINETMKVRAAIEPLKQLLKGETP